MDEAVGSNHPLILCLRLSAGSAKKRIHKEQDLNVIRVAAEVDGMSADIVSVLPHASDLVGRRDDRIRMFGGNGTAARRSACLDECRASCGDGTVLSGPRHLKNSPSNWMG
jgi:hypothetical protein